MVTKVPGRSGLLICSDCGTPLPLSPAGGLIAVAHPLSSSLLLLAMGGFLLLLAFLSYGPSLEPELPKDRAQIRKLTTGQFAKAPVLLDKAPLPHGTAP
ncbi:MAG: hypothetical protein ACKOXO_04165 [Cyanobium sp.]